MYPAVVHDNGHVTTGSVSARRDLRVLAVGMIMLVLVVVAYVDWFHISNALIVAFSLLLIVLAAAATAGLAVEAGAPR